MGSTKTLPYKKCIIGFLNGRIQFDVGMIQINRKVDYNCLYFHEGERFYKEILEMSGIEYISIEHFHLETVINRKKPIFLIYFSCLENPITNTYNSSNPSDPENIIKNYTIDKVEVEFVDV